MLAKSAVFFFLGISFSVLAEEIVDSKTLIKRDGLYFKKIFLNLLLEKSLVPLEEK